MSKCYIYIGTIIVYLMKKFKFECDKFGDRYSFPVVLITRPEIPDFLYFAQSVMYFPLPKTH